MILGEENYAILEPVGDTFCTQNERTVMDFDAAEWRATLYLVLSDHALSYAERLALIEERYAVPVAMGMIEEKRLIASLEYLDEAHRELFMNCCGEVGQPDGEDALLCERFLAYLVYRHASPGATEQDFRLGVGLALVLERLFRAMLLRGGDPIESAVTVSEELEYSEDNTEAIRFALGMREL